MKEIIRSPLDNHVQTILKEKISSSKLIDLYQDQFGIDVSKYFLNLDEISIYECEKTKYRFYYPYNIYGKDEFYQKLEYFDWYYMNWKWEHETAKKLLKGNERILEIGSGGLGFVKKLENDGFDITGLELNSKSIARAKDLKLMVLNESVQEHSKNNFQKYDVVCSFQVLEHIADIRSFLQAQISCLKPEGLLMISVPNNDSFLGLDKSNCLNLPPHHMGLWNKKSLSSLPLIFPDLKVVSMNLEPLQNYHKNYFSDTISNYFFRKFNIQNPLMIKFIKRMISKFHFLFSSNIKAFTIQAVYKKIN